MPRPFIVFHIETTTFFGLNSTFQEFGIKAKVPQYVLARIVDSWQTQIGRFDSTACLFWLWPPTMNIRRSLSDSIFANQPPSCRRRGESFSYKGHELGPARTVLPTRAKLQIETCIGGWPNGTAKSSQLARNHSIVWLRPHRHKTSTKQLGESWLELGVPFGQGLILCMVNSNNSWHELRVLQCLRSFGDNPAPVCKFGAWSFHFLLLQIRFHVGQEEESARDSKSCHTRPGSSACHSKLTEPAW